MSGSDPKMASNLGHEFINQMRDLVTALNENSEKMEEQNEKMDELIEAIDDLSDTMDMRKQIIDSLGAGLQNLIKPGEGG